MLDPKGRREVMEVARTLNKEKGMTVIDITHYMDEAAEADCVYVLDNGRIRLKGTPKEVFEKKEILRACGLELRERLSSRRNCGAREYRFRPIFSTRKN